VALVCAAHHHHHDLTKNIIDLAIKYSDWPPTHWMHTKACEGSSIKLRIGGNFYYPCQDVNALEDHQVLLIAGGVGINPLASIFLHIDDLIGHGQSNCKRVHLVFSAKPQELLFKEKLQEVVLNHLESGMFWTEFLTTMHEDKSQTQHQQRINIEKLRQSLTLFSKSPLFCYLCGPLQMIQDVSRDLKLLLGIPPNHIKYELWW